MVNLMESRRRILLNTPHIETSSGNPLTLTTDMSLLINGGKVYFSKIQNGCYGISLSINGTSIDIPFPKTIYDGYVDLINNEVVETYNLTTPLHYPLSDGLTHLTLGQNLSTIVNGRSSTGGYANSTATGKDGCKFVYFELGWPTDAFLQYSADISRKDDYKSDTRVFADTTTTNANFGDMVIANSSSTDVDGDRLVYIYVSVPSSCTDLASKRAYFANNPVKLTYPKKTPIAYTINLNSLKLINGVNNFQSDANGVIEIKYWKH